MDNQTLIRPELWKAVASTHQAENYSGAIVAAMSVFTDTLRDKSGVDGDGRQLVGKALGSGDSVQAI